VAAFVPPKIRSHAGPLAAFSSERGTVSLGAGAPPRVCSCFSTLYLDFDRTLARLVDDPAETHLDVLLAATLGSLAEFAELLRDSIKR
jgi:hypothetical protein